MGEKVNIQNYIGSKFGHVTVIGKAESKNPRSNSFLLRCDCGKVLVDKPSRVFSGLRRSCGECKYHTYSKYDLSKYESYIGKRINKLTVTSVEYASENDKHAVFVCLCDCGNIRKVLPKDFRKGKIKSCGACIGRNNTGAYARNPEIYKVWSGIMSRCHNTKDQNYYRYGGRGIRVCESWEKYENFERWVLENGGLKDGYSVDRIDNNGDYSPDNCRFATMRQQSRNRRSNTIIEYAGKSMCLIEWSEYLNMDYKALVSRNKRGWDAERMFTTPIRSYHHSQS